MAVIWYLFKYLNQMLKPVKMRARTVIPTGCWLQYSLCQCGRLLVFLSMSCSKAEEKELESSQRATCHVQVCYIFINECSKDKCIHIQFDQDYQNHVALTL